MRTRTTAAAITAGLLLVVTLTACGKSEDEIAADCQKALAAGATTTKTERPDACEGLSQDDYDALVISQGLKDSGVIDDDGNVDMNELLNDNQ
ncbi:hypothetical protein OG369_09875 [Streptomyces sp. NBC_01221]|uniref:hypothetical protein n=1 Tax=Streptomyces sp. NBC_01221 TaxID=2903782 RepID=UPI002251D1EF|nr:hypothetical protein [Streptomyces sp. NBC_01221]MCX4786479.1 hypothetical protein [Streptomyces sp. NBC_01221]